MTIFALSSGAGRAGVAVIRVSGPRAFDAVRALAGREPAADRAAALMTLSDPVSGDTLDRALVLGFRAPRSFTGEDVAELHVHGGRAVVDGVLAALGTLDGLRPAEAGEFTRQAFLNGKLDLTAVEGLADLIAADTEAQRRQAQRVARGDLRALYDGWRADLLRAQALIETAIDFSEEDIPDGLEAEVTDIVDRVSAAIADHLDDGHRGERLRDGYHVVILGAPNVGKSSLLNWLARRDAAIVSDQAGTTRDVVEVHLDLAGFPVIVADTAGLRDSADAVEREGVNRARARADDADLKIYVCDATALPTPDELAGLFGDKTLLVVNKIDLQDIEMSWAPAGRPIIAVSVKTGRGLPDLLDAITDRVRNNLAAGPDLVPTRLRHRSRLEECRRHLTQSATAGTVELRAEDLRLAARALGAIVGQVDVEDILDVIFAEFCIGK